MNNIKSGQTFINKFLERTVLEDKISHAYLFEVNKDSNYMNTILFFVKKILCPSKNEHIDCHNCSICKRIDNNNYPEFKIISSDEGMIKKNQIIDLQEQFSTKAVEGKYKIYLIKDCDKMNVTTANSLLKFLEEPEENIIAILTTTNKNKVLKTIISRCYNIKLTEEQKEIFSTTIENYSKLISNSNEEFLSNVDDKKNLELINKTISLILECNKSKRKVLAYEKEYFNLKKENRREIYNQLDLIIHFYYDILNFKYKTVIKVYTSNINEIEKISNLNSENKVLNILEELIMLRDKYTLNLNQNLVVDKIISIIGGE